MAVGHHLDLGHAECGAGSTPVAPALAVLAELVGQKVQPPRQAGQQRRQLLQPGVDLLAEDLVRPLHQGRWQ